MPNPSPMKSDSEVQHPDDKTKVRIEAPLKPQEKLSPESHSISTTKTTPPEAKTDISVIFAEEEGSVPGIPVIASNGHIFLFPNLTKRSVGTVYETIEKHYGRFVSLQDKNPISINNLPKNGVVLDCVNGKIIWQEYKANPDFSYLDATFSFASIEYSSERNTYDFKLDKDLKLSDQDFSKYATAYHIPNGNLIVRMYQKDGVYYGIDILEVRSDVKGLLSNKHYFADRIGSLNWNRLSLEALDSKPYKLHEAVKYSKKYLPESKFSLFVDSHDNRFAMLSLDQRFMAIIIYQSQNECYLVVYDVTFESLGEFRVLYEEKIGKEVRRNMSGYQAQWRNDNTLIFLKDGNLVSLNPEDLIKNPKAQPVLLQTSIDDHNPRASFDAIFRPFDNDTYVVRRRIPLDQERYQYEYCLKSWLPNIRQQFDQISKEFKDEITLPASGLIFAVTDPVYVKTRELKIDAMVKMHEIGVDLSNDSSDNSLIFKTLCSGVGGANTVLDLGGMRYSISPKSPQQSFMQYIQGILTYFKFQEDKFDQPVKELFALFRSIDRMLVRDDLPFSAIIHPHVFFTSFIKYADKISLNLAYSIRSLYEITNKHLKFFIEFNKNSQTVCNNYFLLDLVDGRKKIEDVKKVYITDLKVTSEQFAASSGIELKQQELDQLKKVMLKLFDNIALQIQQIKLSGDDRYELVINFLNDLVQNNHKHDIAMQRQQVVTQEIRKNVEAKKAERFARMKELGVSMLHRFFTEIKSIPGTTIEDQKQAWDAALADAYPAEYFAPHVREANKPGK